MSNPKKPSRPKGRTGVRVRDADGSWRELKSEHSPSDDPEINKLWDLPISDLDKILENPKHPLNEKAIAVTAQAFAPLQSAVHELVLGQSSSWKRIGESLRANTPNIASSWVSDLVLEYPEWQRFRKSLPEPGNSEPFVVDSIDFDSASPPAASLREVAQAADDAAVVVLKDLLAGQRAQLQQARSDAEANSDALAVARGSRTAGWWAAGAAIAASLIALAGIIVTIVVSR
jgi:hypothetical protein